MLKVIKPSGINRTDDVVMISDLPSPKPDVEHEEALEEESLSQQLAEEDESEERQRQADQVVENAEEMAKRILRSASQEREQQLTQARIDAEEIRAQARQEGYQAAYQEMKPQIVDCLSQTAALLDRIQIQHQQFVQDYSAGLKSLAVDIAEKVLCKQIQQDGTEMTELVKKAVDTIKNADWITVEVSDKLPELVKRLQEEFARTAGDARIEVVGGISKPGACVIETPDGVLDASVQEQMNNLRKAFSDLD